MLLASFSAVFALVFGAIAYRGIPHGWALTRIGWQTFKATADKPDATTNLQRRSILTDGNRFFLAGLGWLLAGIASAGMAVVAGVGVLIFMGIV